MSAIGVHQPHALLIPVPVQGHINPMMHLAWKLISHGFLITFLNTEDTLHRISEATDQKKSDMMRMKCVPMEAQPEDGRDDVIKFAESLDKALGPPVILNLIHNINSQQDQDPKITCIIADFWICSGLQAVADFHGVHLAVLQSATSALASSYKESFLPTAEQSVIYLSFGSFTVVDEEQVEEVALALEAIKRPFLWVVRSDGVKGERALLISRLLKSRGANEGCIVGWAPQLQVLNHPSLACFVTHCGWNSVLESICMGVPMICWPYFTDQFLNRNYVVGVWRVGLPLNPNKDGVVEKEELRRAAEEFLESEKGMGIRDEVKKWKRIVRNAVNEGGSSSNNFNLFVDAVKNIPIKM